MGLKGEDSEGLKAAKERVAALTPDDTLTPEIAQDVCVLWADEGMQARIESAVLVPLRRALLGPGG